MSTVMVMATMTLLLTMTMTLTVIQLLFFFQAPAEVVCSIATGLGRAYHQPGPAMGALTVQMTKIPLSAVSTFIALQSLSSQIRKSFSSHLLSTGRIALRTQ